MTWETFYDRFWDWSESTQINRVSSLREFGPSDEVCEVAEAFSDKKVASRFIRKAIAAGVTFNADDIYNLEGVVEDKLHEEMLRKLTGNMNWDTFYEHFYDWPDDVQIENAKAQKDFGDPEQVCEIASNFINEKDATVFVKNALANGVKFTAKQISDDLVNCVEESFVPVLVKAASTHFNEDEFDMVSSYLSETDQRKVAETCGIEFEEEFEEEEFQEVVAPPRRRGFSPFGFVGALFLAFLGVGGKKKKGYHNGHCDGDCAHCPPHYGYRYGRWYYGRHHQYGCQFGGNHGGGGMN